MQHRPLCLLVLAISIPLLQAADPLVNPYDYYDAALKTGKGGSAVLRAEIADRLSKKKLTAGECLMVAEMLKQIGDRDAESFYRCAIVQDRVEPAYELFFADYFRNFRGPMRPLFSEAERHYLLAVERWNRLPAGNRAGWNERTRSRLWRGLVALHERDGIALVPGGCKNCGAGFGWPAPMLFFSSVNRYSAGGAELDESADVRDYTSEALVSAVRLYDSTVLPSGTSLAMVRAKPGFETLNRLRFRRGDLPALDFFVKQRYTKDAQITRFDRPNEFNNVHVRVIGGSAEKAFTVGSFVDGFLRGSINRVERRGLVERRALAQEQVWEYELRAAASRFVGPDKTTLEVFAARQTIGSEGLRDRPRMFTGATFTYQLFRPVGWLDRKIPVYGQRFETRGINLFAGYLNDAEAFLNRLPSGDVLLRRKDRFAGIAVRGIGRFDLTVQPTLLSAWVGREPREARLNNSQYRTYVTLLARIKDEERTPGLPHDKEGFHVAFVHVVVPFRHDMARRGPDAFENYAIGSQLSVKFFQTTLGTASYLADIRYERQSYYVLGRTLNVMTAGVSVGF